MCGRISQVMGEAGLDDALGGAVFTAATEERYNLGPAQDMLCVVGHRQERRVGRMRWGIKPEWSSRLIINAQWEKASQRSGYWASWRRAIVPASGFYEWRRDGSRRRAHHIHGEGSPLLMAALWRWDSVGEAREAVTVVLTMGAEPWMAALHHRQPVMLHTSGVEGWLEGGEPVRIRGETLKMDAVSAHVNKIANEGPDCWRPASGDLC